MSTQHELRCWPKEFKAIVKELKRFEFRKNDRGFKVGDTLWLREFDLTRAKDYYTGFECYVVINYILEPGEGFSVPKGFCVMSIDMYYFNGWEGKY